MLGWEYLFRCFYSEDGLTEMHDLGHFVLSAGIVGVVGCDYLGCDSLDLLVLLLLQMWAELVFELLLLLLTAVVVVVVFGCVVLVK